MISVSSSGSSSSDSDTEPTRSQNITVICRRSVRLSKSPASSPTRSAGSRPPLSTGRRRWPQRPQKLAIAGLSSLQAGHFTVGAVPQRSHCSKLDGFPIRRPIRSSPRLASTSANQRQTEASHVSHEAVNFRLYFALRRDRILSPPLHLALAHRTVPLE